MEVCRDKEAQFFGNQKGPHIIEVPIALLDGLSDQVETLQKSLVRKQWQLGEVIRRQEEQILLHKEKILQLGLANLQKLSIPGVSLHGVSDDSSMGFERQKEEAQFSYENSDSFVTISDTSFSDSDMSTLAPSPFQEEVIKNRPVLEQCSFQVNPLFDSTPLLESEEADDTEETERVLIGDPEELVESVLERLSCLPRPVRRFRSTSKGSLGRLSRRSRSEGNIMQLMDKDPKYMFHGSFKNLFKSPAVCNIRSSIWKPMIWESGDRQLLSTVNRINTRRPTRSPESSSRPSHFSSWLGFNGLRTEPVSISNHKTVRRPRDVKLRSHLRSQTVAVVAEKYRINYCFC